MLRMLDSEDLKTLGHVGYWVGARLDQMFQINVGNGSAWIPDHFAIMIELLNEAVSAGLVEADNWRAITNKAI